MIAVDTNVLLAAADRDEPRHGACAEILRRYRGELVVPAPVVAEASWMIEPRLGPAAEVRFVRAVANAELVVADLTGADYARCAELIDQYSDMGLGLVDASVVTVCEGRGIAIVATLNRRDFNVVRPRHTVASELLPESPH
jgi:hypothetical protein